MPNRLRYWKDLSKIWLTGFLVAIGAVRVLVTQGTGEDVLTGDERQIIVGTKARIVSQALEFVVPHLCQLADQ